MMTGALALAATSALPARGSATAAAIKPAAFDPLSRMMASAETFRAMTRQVMDLTAVTLCAEQGLPMFVFDISEAANLVSLIAGNQPGTNHPPRHQETPMDLTSLLIFLAIGAVGDPVDREE